jgi:hypothetical protein
MVGEDGRAMVNLFTQARARAQAATDSQSYTPHEPTARQRLFLVDLKDHLEAFYGGAAGGGKSDALLAAALEYVDVPHYSALILRRTYKDLSKPGALLDRARQWLTQTDAVPIDGGKQWRFPSGAVLSFGYLENESDKYQYQSAEYQFIGFDEVTQFSESQYTYLFSRLRRLVDSDIPIRMRAASNPADEPTGFWVAERFVPDDFTPEDAVTPKIIWKATPDRNNQIVKRAFVPARMEDNPHLDRESYDKSLDELDDVTREQLARGDWRMKRRGNIYTMWNEYYHVISWSDFEKVFGVREIPGHWNCGIAQDWGTTKSHPCVTTLFTTAAANSPLPGCVFIPWGAVLYDAQDAQQVADDCLIPALDRLHVRDRIKGWWMSHEASSERNGYRKKGLPFQTWGQDANGGIDAVRRYLKIKDKDRLNPFGRRDHKGEPLMGHPMLMLVVDDAELIHPKTDVGLARWRAEFAGYAYHVPKAGDPPEKLRPQKLFNDAMDTVRCYAEREFPAIKPLTQEEKIQAAIPAEHRPEAIAQVPPAQRVAAENAAILARHIAAKRVQETASRSSGGLYSDIRERYYQHRS